jgi:hypothetical protein
MGFRKLFLWFLEELDLFWLIMGVCRSGADCRCRRDAMVALPEILNVPYPKSSFGQESVLFLHHWLPPFSTFCFFRWALSVTNYKILMPITGGKWRHAVPGRSRFKEVRLCAMILKVHPINGSALTTRQMRVYIDKTPVVGFARSLMDHMNNDASSQV